MPQVRRVTARYAREQPWACLWRSICAAAISNRCAASRSVQTFVDELCALTQAKKLGEAGIVDFGEDPGAAGYWLTQLIEPALPSAHFAQPARAFIDRFSRAPYKPYQGAWFCRAFSDAGEARIAAIAFRYL